MILGSCALQGRSGHAAGRELLAALYRQATGEEMPEIRVTRRGKPYFPDSPWHFSITHTPRHAFCVLARENVGIDAEELDRAVNPAIAEKILSPGEMTQYRAAPDPRVALLTFWVLKEAAAKLTGEGLRGYPSCTDFSLDDPRVCVRDNCLLAIMTEGSHAV